MKKLLLILLTFSSSSFAQNKSYKQFRDYWVMLNTDSLQKIVDLQKDKTTILYLNNLVDLEFSRYYYSNDFGKDLEIIKTIALQKKNQQALAIYHLLEAMKFRLIDSKVAFNSVLKANQYFAQQKDTLGLIFSNYMIIKVSRDGFLNKNNSKNITIPIFENTLMYYNQTNDVRAKLYIIRLILNYGHDLGMNIPKALIFYKEAIKLLDKHPEYNYLRYEIYRGAANVYFRIPNKRKEYLKCYLLAYQSSSLRPTRSTVTALHNLGYGYAYMNEYKQAEVYFKKGIALYDSLKTNDLDQSYLLYSELSKAQYKLKDYKNAYESRLKANSIQKIVNKELKFKEMQELQTKYETEKKDVTIKNLELQKQVTEGRTRLVLFILGLTCLIIVAVSFLALRLRDANKRLKKLTQSRDKLFTIISHDLRSPFNSYQRYSEIVGYLIKNKQYNRLQEVLKKVDELGLNLAALLNNLLEWSIVQQKQVRITPSVINIQGFFNGLLPIYRDMARLKGLTIVEDFQDQEIRVDPHLLSLITRNLLDNAIKYTPEGNQITLQTHIKENDFVLTISNQGDSMTTTQSEKIRALFNNHYDYEFGEEGLGIGLILIKEFARTNAVRINFEHNNNLTTFEVLISRVFF